MFYFISQKFVLPSCLLLPRVWILNTHTPQIQTQHSVEVMTVLFQTWEVYFHFLFKYLFYVYRYEPEGMCVHQVFAVPTENRRGHQIPLELKLIDGCVQAYKFWKLKLSPLVEPAGLLTAEPTLYLS